MIDFLSPRDVTDRDRSASRILMNLPMTQCLVQLGHSFPHLIEQEISQQRLERVQCHQFCRNLIWASFHFQIILFSLFSFVSPYRYPVDCQDDQDGPYRGKFIDKFNSYHHQVSGDVYAVDASTFLIVNFNYDGNGIDTFFWSGASNRPGPQGFIVPDEFGKWVDVQVVLID